jgi:rifampicin phosphotransferase
MTTSDAGGGGPPPLEETGWVYEYASSTAIPSPTSIGGKGHHLAQLREAGARVPSFVVLNSAAFEALVTDAHGWPSSPEEARSIQAALSELGIPNALRAQLQKALRRQGLLGIPLAVRSSAADEDGEGASFAGQFRTVLGVRWEEGGGVDAIWDAVRAVWGSAFEAHALAYAADTHGGSPVRMAVVLQAMVDAEASGVAFSVDPVDGRRDTAVVSAIRGLGEPLVSGELDGDTYRVRFPRRSPRDSPGLEGTPNRGGPEPFPAEPLEIQPTLRPQGYLLRMGECGGTHRVELPSEPDRGPVLADEEVTRIAQACRELEAAFGSPQDVEWALTAATSDPGSRSLVLLQARPITALPREAPGERRVWDNSNIIESYSGVTTPLTFSFARSVYNDVYIQFCRLLGVSEELLAAQRHVFANMLGMVRGRVYYNLLNWYRLIALLPGYDVNREFMERMMGVREALPDPPAPPRASARWKDGGRVVRMVARMIREYGRLDREVARFHARVDAELDPLAHEELGRWTPDELVALYQRLEDSLLHHWRAPLVNDFFAMIFFGLLGRLTEKWLPQEPATLTNDLLCGEGGVISTEPARRVMELARQVHRTPELHALFTRESDDLRLWSILAGADGDETEGDHGSPARRDSTGALEALAQADPPHPEFQAELVRYLDDFGNRCMNELKLETVTPHEDPSFLVEMVRAYVEAEAVDPEEGQAREADIRASAEARVRAGLRGPRRWIYRWVLTQARHRIRDRENLRFERTRVFGIVRRIFTALGGCLSRSGSLERRDDVFYLTIHEVFAHVNGTGATSDLTSIVAIRRDEFNRFREEPDPPDRFETVGPPADATPAGTAGVGVQGDLSGLGCCPGRLRAPVRVVRDPRNPGVLNGHILVADRTDPGWTLLFPRALGILVERGSLLSHSAIVAREMGLPCVVAVTGLMDTLKDGEMVEMDGTTGLIRRLGEGAEGMGGRGDDGL